MTTLIILIAVIVLVLGGIGLFVRRGRTPSAGSRASKPRPTPASPPPKKPPVVEQDEEVLVPGDHPFADEESLAIGDENEKEDDLAGDAPVYRERLNRSRGLFATLRSLRGGSAFEESAYEELERALLSADVGVQTTDLLLSRVRQRVEVDQGDGTELIDVLRSEMIQLLDHDDSGAVINRELSTAVDGDHVPVWLFVGVNGVRPPRSESWRPERAPRARSSSWRLAIPFEPQREINSPFGQNAPEPTSYAVLKEEIRQRLSSMPFNVVGQETTTSCWLIRRGASITK